MRRLIHLARQHFGAKTAPRFDDRIEGRLTDLLEGADPSPGLFARIEAQIDAEEVRARQGRRRGHALWSLAVFAAGVAAGLLAMHAAAPPRQPVAAFSSGTAPAALGAVTLHGPALRSFLRARCAGAGVEHVVLTLAPVTASGAEGTGPEKIRLACNH